MRKFIFLLYSLFVAVAASAQLTASRAFITAPQSVFPLLDPATRMDMVDYRNSGLDVKSTNALSGSSVVTALSPRKISLRTTDASTSQLALLTQGKDTVIALVTTLATPGLDSSIRFFASDWKALPDKFTRPQMKDWATAEGRSHLGEIEAQVPFMLASYDIDPDAGTLVVTNNLSSFLDPAIWDMLKGWLQPSLTYAWTGNEFKMKN